MPLLHTLTRTAAVVSLTAACAGRTITPAGARSSTLSDAITARAARTPGAVIRVVAARLDGKGPRVAINADSLVHAASTMKVPVMIALAQAADRGALRLDDAVTLTNQYTSIVDSSLYTLDSTADSDDEVYKRVGERVPIRWLATRMITHSSNLATNMLLTVVRADSVTAMTRRLGTTRMLVRRGVEDTPAFRAGLNNVTTANDLAALMVAIAKDRAASPLSCAWMRDVLFAQHWNDAIPVGLPKDVRIAHKTGNITAVEHDAAIVYPERGAPYVLVVLTSGVANGDEAKTLIADIARIIHPAMR